MSTLATQRPRQPLLLPEDERRYEIVDGVRVDLDEEPEPDIVDGVPDDAFYEVIRGVRVECPPMASSASHVKSQLGRRLGNHVEAADLGRAEVETMFLIVPEAKTSRCPDVAFVSFDRWARDRRVPRAASWPVVPDLAVEVVSPTDRAEAALEKVREYFDNGVRQVWVIYPELRLAHVFESFTSIRVLLEADGELDGGEVVPGFRLALAILFADIE